MSPVAGSVSYISALSYVHSTHFFLSILTLQDDYRVPHLPSQTNYGQVPNGKRDEFDVGGFFTKHPRVHFVQPEPIQNAHALSQTSQVPP